MNQGRTLWEIFRDWLSGPVEMRYANPWKAKIGCAVRVNQIDLSDLNFFLREILEYRRNLGPGQKFVFTDYHVLARPLQGDDVSLKLRLMPEDDTHPVVGPTFTLIQLKLEDEFGFDQGFLDVLNDDTGKFEVRSGETLEAEYWRVNDLRTPYKAAVTVIRDENNDSRVTSDEVQGHLLEYWDYWRQTHDESGGTVREFLFVEMNRRTGMFQIWRGQPIGPETVTVF